MAGAVEFASSTTKPAKQDFAGFVARGGED
jgi:hypothetical protein